MAIEVGQGPAMGRPRHWRMAISFCLAAAFSIAIFVWLLFWPADPKLHAIQARVAAWGGGVRRYPDRQGSQELLRPWIGDKLADRLSSSKGTHVFAQGNTSQPSQLAEMLEAEPFSVVQLSGTNGVDDN